MQQNNKIVLVSDYGRSGQGWLSYMLCYILNARFVEPYNFIQGQKYTSSEHIFSLTQGNLPDRDRTDYSLIVKTHSIFPGQISLTDKVIFLIRDPRDVAISMYGMNLAQERTVGWNHPRAKFSLVFKKYFRLLSYIETIYEWQMHFNSWKDTKKFNVTYEGLLSDPEKSLKDILGYLEVPTNDKVIREAIENFSFQKITGRKNGEENEGSLEFRKGIAGDYKNKFSKTDIRVINFIFKKVIKEAGYSL